MRDSSLLRHLVSIRVKYTDDLTLTGPLKFCHRNNKTYAFCQHSPEALSLPPSNHCIFPAVMSQSFTLWKSWNHFNLDRANLPQNTSGFSKLNLYKSSCVLMLGTPSNSGKGVVVADVVMPR